MSDHAWLPQALVDEVMGVLVEHREKLRNRVHELAGDDLAELRAIVQAEVFDLDEVERQMRALLGAPREVGAVELARPQEQVPVLAKGRHRALPGEQTGAWRRGEASQMLRNRGPL